MIVFDTWIAILVLAILIDILIGEPPEEIHPVVWIGTVIDHLDGRIVRVGGCLDLLKGAGLLATCILLFGLVTFIVMDITGRWFLLEVIVGGFILKSTFSFRYFKDAVRKVYEALSEKDLDLARSQISMLVSRKTDELDEPHLVSATLETASENLVDGIIAPLLFFSVFGVVGAVIYRVINTADSMLGYRNERYRDVGFVSAKLDDLLNFIPARAGGVLIALACMRGFDTMIENRKKCPSPNSCYPMAAIAGGLGVWLEKSGEYRINEEGRAPTPRDIDRCLEVMDLVFVMVILIVVVILTGW
ncbi:MAG: Cobalamin (vitamin B12) biosynthesis CbiB [Candidatus Syntrophoarchaeum caldarius]|uniref:Probable cobalamin biosynthesis protein CobD n=1 Tax=Candidatus Syntropharchaeum caldarium TaxID=1838285 RepID=A0A1F2P973_9EURY|nr:MAG: Cobalamin (vitamin B12) biosynthesis CbiB [Candidatus Syntrophoarchaeum caldarius]